MKRLKNIEDNEEQLKVIENKTENVKEITDVGKEPLSLEAKELIEEIKIIQKDVDYRKLNITGITILHMILVVIKHLKSYLETLITEIWQ